MNVTIILAAGLSSRIHELSFDRPKSLLGVGGSTLLLRLCHSFAAGTDKFIVVSGNNSDSIQAAMTGHDYDTDFIIDNSVSDYGNAWSLKVALYKVPDQCQNCLILEADVVLAPEAIKQFNDETSTEKCLTIPALTSHDDKIYRNSHLNIAISKTPPKEANILGKYLGVGRYPYTKLMTLIETIPDHSEAGYAEYIATIMGSDTRFIHVNSDSACEIDTKEDYKKVLSNPNFYKTNKVSRDTFFKNYQLQLKSGHIKRIVGVHDVFGAKLVQNNGFDAIWLGSFQIALSRGIEDNSDYDPFTALNLAEELRKAGCILPLIVDAGNGFIDFQKLKLFVKKAISLGVTALCVEDNETDRVCSLYKGIQRNLISHEEFAQRVSEFVEYGAGKIQIIARTEALTIDYPDEEAAQRLNVAIRAGANAVLPHYVDSDFNKIEKWLTNYSFAVPLILIPTGLVSYPIKNFKSLGCAAIVYANIDLRLRYHFLQESYSSLSAETFLEDERMINLAEPALMKAALDN